MTANYKDAVQNSPLGKAVHYDHPYDPSLLFIIPRKEQRESLSIPVSQGESLPFYGIDTWNAYELSWLDNKGKPCVATAIFTVPCISPQLYESKALKLYLNSFNQTPFNSLTDVKNTLITDLSKATGSTVNVEMNPATHFSNLSLEKMQGTCLDTLDVQCDTYDINPSLLKNDPTKIITETVYSHLFKSNCPITHQPDWASVQISYTGPEISQASLLQYLVSYRNHNEFHEHCCERIFMDIMRYCKPEILTVDLRFTRRGGIDINPFRSTKNELPSSTRLWRQ
jgi:7-cyano-7-deazaguanine reductase